MALSHGEWETAFPGPTSSKRLPALCLDRRERRVGPQTGLWGSAGCQGRQKQTGGPVCVRDDTGCWWGGGS